MRKAKGKNIYMIGIKGVGMTMLAQFLAESGARVSGSDIADVFLTDRVLREEKIPVKSPFDPKNIPAKIDLIIHSSAFSPENNCELAWIAKQPGIFSKTEVASYAPALAQQFNRLYGIAVCGSHGKTTTSAWLGYVLLSAGLDPNVLVGSRAPQLGGSARRGRSRLMVAEVDEYQNKLRYFAPQGILLNNIDFDHPDFFKDRAAYRRVFADFIKRLPRRGWLVLNGEDEEIAKIRRACPAKAISYGLARSAGPSNYDYLASDIKADSRGQSFLLNGRRRLRIALPGEHNVLNALAVVAASRRLGVSWDKLIPALADFQGTDRRGQILGRYRGALIIDDYAHHPTEIRSTLAGIRSRYPKKRLITVFHPHTYTRTRALFKEFAASFSLSDALIILDIYGSAREKQGGVSSAQLLEAVRKHNQKRGVKQGLKHIASLAGAARYLSARLGADDLLLLMGAGDVFRVGEALLKKNN